MVGALLQLGIPTTIPALPSVPTCRWTSTGRADSWCISRYHSFSPPLPLLKTS